MATSGARGATSGASGASSGASGASSGASGANYENDTKENYEPHPRTTTYIHHSIRRRQGPCPLQGRQTELWSNARAHSAGE